MREVGAIEVVLVVLFVGIRHEGVGVARRETDSPEREITHEMADERGRGIGQKSWGGSP